MSRNADVTLEWGDGEYKFRLAVGGLRELQEKCGDVGPGVIFESTLNVIGNWKVDYIREPIRIGLIGGGLKPPEALRLVKIYVDGRPLAENLPVANAIVGAALFGVEGEQLKKSGEEAGTADLQHSQGVNSDSPRSMDAAL